MRRFVSALAIIILVATAAHAQHDTLFLNNGDTVVCEITAINFDKEVTCIVKEGENAGKTIEYRRYEVESIWTTKSFKQLAYQNDPGYYLASGGHSLRTAGILNLVSTVTVIGGAFLLDGANDPAVPAILMGAGTIMAITSVALQISAGNSLKKSGLLLNKLELGSTRDGVGVRIRI